MQKICLLGHCRILCFFVPKKLELEYTLTSFFDEPRPLYLFSSAYFEIQRQKLEGIRSSSSFFGQTRMRTRSSSFLVQVAPQSVPGHPEAKSGQNLIRNGLLEAILEASRPASKPASQAQPLGRVFSTKRTRGQDRRVFSGQKPVQSKKLRCARSSSSFFVQKHVQSKKLEVIRSDSSFFG